MREWAGEREWEKEWERSWMRKENEGEILNERSRERAAFCMIFPRQSINNNFLPISVRHNAEACFFLLQKKRKEKYNNKHISMNMGFVCSLWHGKCTGGGGSSSNSSNDTMHSISYLSLRFQRSYFSIASKWLECGNIEANNLCHALAVAHVGSVAGIEAADVTAIDAVMPLLYFCCCGRRRRRYLLLSLLLVILFLASVILSKFNFYSCMWALLVPQQMLLKEEMFLKWQRKWEKRRSKVQYWMVAVYVCCESRNVNVHRVVSLSLSLSLSRVGNKRKIVIFFHH